MNKLVAYVVFILAGLLVSCQDSEEFKIPTSVGFQMDINRNTSTNGRLNFTRGYLRLVFFGFEGRREEGGDVDFTKSYGQGLLVNFDSDKPIEALQFQIPQGNYTRIEIELEASGDTDGSSLVVMGWYQHSNGTLYPVRFELNSSFDFEIEAREQSGNSQIVLKQGTPATAKISLDPLKWFEAVPVSYLENAIIAVEEGESRGDLEIGEAYILINEEHNENIYEIIISRIEQSAQINFQ